MNKEHLEGTYYTNSEMTLNEFEFEFDKSQLVTLNEFDKSQCDWKGNALHIGKKNMCGGAELVASICYERVLCSSLLHAL